MSGRTGSAGKAGFFLSSHISGVNPWTQRRLLSGCTVSCLAFLFHFEIVLRQLPAKPLLALRSCLRRGNSAFCFVGVGKSICWVDAMPVALPRFCSPQGADVGRERCRARSGSREGFWARNALDSIRLWAFLSTADKQEPEQRLSWPSGKEQLLPPSPTPGCRHDSPPLWGWGTLRRCSCPVIHKGWRLRPRHGAYATSFAEKPLSF